MLRSLVSGALVMAATLLLCAAAPVNNPPPAWAYIIPSFAGIAAPHGVIAVPGSTLRVRAKQLESYFYAPDWFPQDHPVMPKIVAVGHAPKAYACAVCHLPTGVGDPASAVLAGLPAAYIEQQFAEFRSGRRGCPVPKDVACSKAMPYEARAVSRRELQEAAAYFSKLPYHSRIHVVEAAMVPHTQVRGFTLAPQSGRLEPIGQRILELPDTVADNADWRHTITAFVPPGSLQRGKVLAKGGAGAAPCASCHGPQLRGLGMVPPLAGRSPSYLYRQLYDIQYGYRHGAAIALMRPEVAHLSAGDRLALAAYLASLPG